MSVQFFEPHSSDHYENQPKQLHCVDCCITTNNEPSKICDGYPAFEVTFCRFLCEIPKSYFT